MENTNKKQIESLLELKTLYERGILTKEELDVEKRKILGGNTFDESIPSVQQKKEDPLPETNQEIAVEMDDVDYSISEESVSSKNKYFIIGTIAVILVIAGFIIVPKLNNRDANTEIGSESEIELATTVDAYNDYEGYNVILSERKLTEDDLAGKSKEELRLLRNMIYARYGYRFKSDDLFQHFSKYSWYAPTTSDGSYVYGKMSEIEKYNIDFIKQHEESFDSKESDSQEDTEFRQFAGIIQGEKAQYTFEMALYIQDDGDVNGCYYVTNGANERVLLKGNVAYWEDEHEGPIILYEYKTEKNTKTGYYFNGILHINYSERGNFNGYYIDGTYCNGSNINWPFLAEPASQQNDIEQF